MFIKDLPMGEMFMMASYPGLLFVKLPKRYRIGWELGRRRMGRFLYILGDCRVVYIKTDVERKVNCERK